MTNINIGKKGREKGKLNWPKDGLTKEALKFDQHGVGVGEGAARFSRYLGILVQDSNQIQLSYSAPAVTPLTGFSLLTLNSCLTILSAGLKTTGYFICRNPLCKKSVHCYY